MFFLGFSHQFWAITYFFSNSYIFELLMIPLARK